MADHAFKAFPLPEAYAAEHATLEDILSDENLPMESSPLTPPRPPPKQKLRQLLHNGKSLPANWSKNGRQRRLFGIGDTKKSAAASVAVKQRMLFNQPKLGCLQGTTRSNQSKCHESFYKSRLQFQEYILNMPMDISANNPENARFDELKLSPFYEGYETRTLLEKWRELPTRLTISDWAFYIRTTQRRSNRSQVDCLVGDVCAKVLSMREMLQYSLDSGAHCLLWVNSGLARRFLPRMRNGSQILGRVQSDVIVRDKQSLASLLMEHKFTEWAEWQTHVCLNEKHQEIKRNSQRLCRHQYIGHYMGKCIDEDAQNCPNRDYYFCECFRRHFFLPDFVAFSHYYLMEEFLKKYETDIEFKKTVWMAKPAYLTGGKGFFLIRDANEFRYFYLVRSDSCVRRESFTLQRYLSRPCTLNNMKVDCRMYLMVTVLNGRRVCGFFHPGFVRTAAAPWKFDPSSGVKMTGNIFEHVTATELYKLSNKTIRVQNDDHDDDEKAQCFGFNEACEMIITGAKKIKIGEAENVLPFAREEDDGGRFVEKNFEKFHWRFKYMIEVLCAKMDPIVRDKPGTFQIFGLDIFIDSDTKPWLLEVNSHVATEQIYDRSQCKVISNVVTEAICIVVELFQKAFEEETIALEIEQRETPLAKLSRSQRFMTAKDQQEAIDKLTALMEMTEISKRKPPIFMQNFFWWYDTPRYRWIKPWVIRKPRPVQQIPWYSQMFLSLIKRNDASIRSNFKANEATTCHDNKDYFKHVFWRKQLEAQINAFERKLQQRGEKFQQQVKSDNTSSQQQSVEDSPGRQVSESNSSSRNGF